VDNFPRVALKGLEVEELKLGSAMVILIFCVAFANAELCSSIWLINESYVFNNTSYFQSIQNDCELVKPEDYTTLEAAQKAAYREFEGEMDISLEVFAASLWKNGWKKEPMILAKYDKQVPLTGGNQIDAGETIFTASTNRYGMWESNNVNLPSSGLKPIEYNAYYNPQTGKIESICRVVINWAKRFNATE
jgi:hypothetical protein